MTTPELTCPLTDLLAARAPAPAPPPPLPAAGPDGGAVRLLWTLDMAAARVSIGKTKLYGLIRNDVLPSIVLGGRRYVAEQDLVEFVERLRTGWTPWG